MRKAGLVLNYKVSVMRLNNSLDHVVTKDGLNPRNRNLDAVKLPLLQLEETTGYF